MATVYSDSIIVDAMPQQSQPPDENENYIKESGKIIQVETRENHLTRQQVVHMLKSRFKNDYDQWQSNKDRAVSDTSAILIQPFGKNKVTKLESEAESLSRIRIAIFFQYFILFYIDKNVNEDGRENQICQTLNSNRHLLHGDNVTDL
jgi:hypothetical protein